MTGQVDSHAVDFGSHCYDTGFTNLLWQQLDVDLAVSLDSGFHAGRLNLVCDHAQQVQHDTKHAHAEQGQECLDHYRACGHFPTSEQTHVEQNAGFSLPSSKAYLKIHVFPVWVSRRLAREAARALISPPLEG
ncbi:MAG: hypothetical protein IPK19_18075 [Chloroflexi bacterium]|nr:hypothetical protein [Chloroflexota bacterium]